MPPAYPVLCGCIHAVDLERFLTLLNIKHVWVLLRGMQFAQVQTMSREHQRKQLTTHHSWAHLLSSVCSVGAEHGNFTSNGKWAGHTEFIPRNKCWTKSVVFLSSWNSWYNISGTTGLCLDSLVYDLGCVWAPTGSWAPGVSREKNIKSYRSHQDRIPEWEKRPFSVKHGCTQSLTERDLLWSCALYICMPNYSVFTPIL